MILTIDNLRAGLKWWRDKDWGSTIINDEYDEIYRVRMNGPTHEWWKGTVDRLRKWRALRSPKPGITVAEICGRGEKVLGQIQQQYGLIKTSGDEPSITDCQWEDVETLFRLASEVKATQSPVFASKMCHFLFPKLFIVMDSSGTSVFPYELYWRGMKDAWRSMKEKNEAMNLLRNAIDAEEPHSLYPWETKIMELTQIGYTHG